MKTKREVWKASAFDFCDKEVEVFGPDGFRMMVDYDDVDHVAVEATARKMIAILNKHWSES